MVRQVKLWLVAWLLPVLLRWRDEPALGEPAPKSPMEPPSPSLVALVSNFLMSLDGTQRLTFERFGIQASLLYERFHDWIDDPSFTCEKRTFGAALRASGYAKPIVRENLQCYQSTEMYVAKRMVRP